MLKSVMAVLAGLVCALVTALGLDFVFERLFPKQFGPNGEVQSIAMLLVILLYTLASCGFGGWVTAWIARDRARNSALTLAGLMVALTTFGMTFVVNPLPLWWRMAGVGLVGPAVVLGGWWSRLRIPSVGSAA